MKKKFVLLLSVVTIFVGSVQAQVEQMTNKNGVPILPEAGSFALGFDAMPFFRFVGNMFNGNVDNGLYAGFSNQGGTSFGGTVYGKYFLTESNAIRARLSINQSTIQDVNRVLEDGQTIPQTNIEVEDERITNSFGIELGGGLEFRRNKGRLVGVYGGEALIGLSTSNQQFTYGNEINSANQTPTSTTDFNSGASASLDSRIITRTNPNSFSIGAIGFVGVEYFFAPQISIGAEFNLGIRYTGTNRSEIISQEWDANSNSVIETSNVGGGRLTNFGIATGVWGGSINLMFHF